MKRKLRVIIAIIEFLSFAFLSIIYYFGYYTRFDIQWGVSTVALIWGIPIAIAALAVLASGIFTWKNRSWKWGVSGVGMAIIALIYTGILFNSFSNVLLPQQSDISQQATSNEENKILTLAIEDRFDSYRGNRYTIVKPDTVITLTETENINEIREHLDKPGYDFTSLIDTLIDTNEKQVRLNIPSSIQNGYYIDYDGIFSRYYREGDVNLYRWNLFHPQVFGYTEVSLPAYDPATGYVLIYLGHTNNSLRHFGGGGDIWVYKYSNGELLVVDVVMLWVK